MSAQRYHEGGYVGGPEMIAWIHPEECIIAKRGDAFVCIREHAHAAKR